MASTADTAQPVNTTATTASKKGKLTSELWAGVLVAFTAIGGLAKTCQPDNWQGVVAAILGIASISCVYIWSRTNVKVGGSR